MKRQKDKKLGRRNKMKKDEDKKESIVTSGQFCPLAMFRISRLFFRSQRWISSLSTRPWERPCFRCQRNALLKNGSQHSLQLLIPQHSEISSRYMFHWLPLHSIICSIIWLVSKDIYSHWYDLKLNTRNTFLCSLQMYWCQPWLWGNLFIMIKK